MTTKTYSKDISSKYSEAKSKIQELSEKKETFMIISSYNKLTVCIGTIKKLEKKYVNGFPKKRVTIVENGKITTVYITMKCPKELAV